MENKICVYAICKNESKFVEKWLNSMSEADYIVVLDTGSEDETYELLKNDARVYRCEQKVITPWRFDVARNESMKLIPEDANILLCTDLDEVLDPGWAQIIKDNWIDGFHVRGGYKYAWSHNSKGEPGRIFYYDKLHDRNWHWAAPVHEFLESGIYDNDYVYNYTLNLFDSGVYLHHYPDQEKSRGSYLGLLELRAEENPNDYYGKYYLSHEYYYRGMYEKSIEVLNDILTNPKHMAFHSPLEKAAAYLFMGDDYRALGDNTSALNAYNKAIREEPTYREPYLYIAEIYNEMGLNHSAIGMVNDALKNSIRHYNWLERDDSWNEKPYDILSVAYYYTGELEKSHYYAIIAERCNPSDDRIKYNLNLVEEKIKNF